MSKVTTNINLDSNLKKQAQILFAELGMDLTTAVTCFLKQSVREQRIPFQISRYVPNEVTRAALEEHEAMAKPDSEYKRYDTIEEALKEVL